MAREYITIPRHMYLWSIERAGYGVDDFLKSNPAVAAYISGEKNPTVRQLESFADKVHVPVGFLLLPSPPVETSPIPMFRGKAGKGKFDLNVYQTILDIQVRQEWLSEYIEENELDTCHFTGRYSPDIPVGKMAGILRQYIRLEQDWMMSFTTPEKAVDHLTDKIEEAGVCVFFNGVVGNNTHRILDVEECRGFALVTDTNAPMIFVNNKDSKRAQLFTLAHEFSHVLLGVSAGYAGVDGEYHDMIENYCDRVAAEFLVPSALLKEYWSDIETCANRFNVSRLVIARRAHDLNLITGEEYHDFYMEYRKSLFRVKNRGTGGDFYASARKRVGRLFALHVNSAVLSNQLSYTQAYRLTGLYGKTYDNFMRKTV